MRLRFPAGPRISSSTLPSSRTFTPAILGCRRSGGDIADLANAQKPDLTVLLGDYVCAHRLVSGYVPPGALAEQLAQLEAPLGVYAILGNHDWLSAAIP